METGLQLAILKGIGLEKDHSSFTGDFLEACKRAADTLCAHLFQYYVANKTAFLSEELCYLIEDLGSRSSNDWKSYMRMRLACSHIVDVCIAHVNSSAERRNNAFEIIAQYIRSNILADPLKSKVYQLP